MNWNKRGYRDRFSNQQMHIMDKRKKEDESRQKEAARKEEQLRLKDGILKFLSNQVNSVPIQDISKELGISDKESLAIIDTIKEVEKVVTPLDGENTSLTYKLKG